MEIVESEPWIVINFLLHGFKVLGAGLMRKLGSKGLRSFVARKVTAFEAREAPNRTP